MNTDLSEKDKTEIVKFIDNILYFDEDKTGSVTIPLRSFASSEKYNDLEEMELEVDLLVKKLKKISPAAILKCEPCTDLNPDVLEIWGVEIKYSVEELKKIRDDLTTDEYI